MTVDVHILGSVSESHLAILQVWGIPNRPTGVLARIHIIDPSKGYFGFDGSGLLPFDVGILFDGTSF
jgi:hypothetical protein